MKKFFFLFTVFVVCLTSCVSTKDSYMIPAEVSFWDSTVYKVKIKQPVTLKIKENRITFKANSSIHYYPSSSSISYGYLAHSQIVLVKGQELEAKAVGERSADRGAYDITFNPNGSICSIFLDKDTVIKVGSHDFCFKAATTLEPLIIDGPSESEQKEIRKRRIYFREDISFDENGNLRSGYLAKSYIINGIELNSGTSVVFDERGELKYYTIFFEDGYRKDYSIH